MSRKNKFPNAEYLEPDENGVPPLHHEIAKDPPFSGIPKRVKFQPEDFLESDRTGKMALHVLAENPAACRVLKSRLARQLVFGKRAGGIPRKMAGRINASAGFPHTIRVGPYTRRRTVALPALSRGMTGMARPSPLQTALEKGTLDAFMKILPDREQKALSLGYICNGAGKLTDADRGRIFCGATPAEARRRMEQVKTLGLIRGKRDVESWWATVPPDYRTKGVRQVHAGLLAYVGRRKTTAPKRAPSISRGLGR